jgi:hypothetical protein
MRKSVSLVSLLCFMFSAPFVLLAVYYRVLPIELPVVRFSIGHVTLVASKSLFMVFRVPLMNLIHGLMSAVMLSYATVFENTARRLSYSNMYLTLLLAVGWKSDFEAAEFVTRAAPALLGYAPWFGFGTLFSVVVGVVVALIRGRRVPLPWSELRLSIRDKIILAGLFAVYVAVVIFSLLCSYRA